MKASRRRVVIAKPGESKRDRLSRPGEIRQIGVDVGEDRAVPGRCGSTSLTSAPPFT